MPTITIIIVTYNGARYIQQCLASIFRSEYKGTYEVVVVDNASTDASADIVEKEFPRAQLIRNSKNTGFVGGNNLGIAEALKTNAEYVFLLNQDTEIEPTTLANMVTTAQKTDAGIAQALLVLGTERNLTNTAGNVLHYLGFGYVGHYREQVSDWITRAPVAIGYATGAAMLIKRDVIEKIGMFDEKFFAYHEDLDLCWRAHLAGYKIMLAPSAIVYHHYLFNRNPNMLYWTERNRLAVLLQNYSAKTLLLLLPMLLVIECAMLGYSLLGGWFGKKVSTYGWLLSHAREILSTRKKVQRMRTLSDKQLWVHMQSALAFSEVKNPLVTYIMNPLVRIYFILIRSFV